VIAMSDASPHDRRVLVAYATKNGFTAGIADMIATALIEGVSAEVRPVRSARSSPTTR
jgi:menaquinone-dependent protoporphyrinogen IX oxidase